ncbi:MAG: UDP-glucose 4-epimerase GalE [Azospirillaceae bacterium]|nr:UDP-glucose 4-epimerase GalE [Azospirillaceae bacterium]
MSAPARVLVTGGAGYVGSHVCHALAGQGLVPVTFDHLGNGHRDAEKWGPLRVGDIQDPIALAQAFAEFSPVAVIHCAALAYVGESVTTPAAYYRNNVTGTLSLLDAMAGAGVKHVVFSSSCATYGIPEQIPIPEAARQQPINPYGRTKLMVEQILSDYGAAYGVNSAVLRYFNAAGADPGNGIGERHDPETHLIPRAILAATRQIPWLEVFGDDYDTPDGTCQRDYIHVSDLAQGHVLALKHLLAGRGSLTLNLGTGRPISVREIVAAVEAVSRRRVPLRFCSRRPGDPPVLYADPSNARNILGFSAAFTAIEDIVETAWRFHVQMQECATPHFGSLGGAKELKCH